ncbi:MAG: AAA family ATPase [Verrucomicrobiae bacterium]|nr:AAA family ATPase [Verrucomicrobiae bacterium]
MPDLFDHAMQERMKSEAPLAARMRPRTLDEYIGQEHIIGEGKLLRRAIEADRLFSSIILWGPPGTGKTTLAQVIANTTKSHFVTISAILAGKADLRVVIDEALERRRLHNERTILFVDEVHRWNKAQQDALLPHVETGVFTLIGATTENPYFEVIKALISRSRVFQLRNLNQQETGILLDRALSDKERGYGHKKIIFDADARAHLIEVASGDARNALNALELAVESTTPDKDGVIHITLDVAQESIQRRAVLYDKDGDAHYDTISAFIKSVRGSDPDAAIYWLAKMLYAGEDPRFIARRLAILAAEDIGLAEPGALVVANACFQIVELIGMPEARIPLAETTIYLAGCPKSNSADKAIEAALKDVKEGRLQEVPRKLRGTGYRGAEKLGHGVGYRSPHDHSDHYVEQAHMPVQATYYAPSELGRERKLKEYLESVRAGAAKRKKAS